MRVKDFTQEQIDKIIAQYKVNQNYSQVARDNGISSGMVKSIVCQNIDIDLPNIKRKTYVSLAKDTKLPLEPSYKVPVDFSTVAKNLRQEIYNNGGLL